MTHDDLKQLVIQDKDILGGTPVFVGTRVPVQILFDYLETEDRLDEFLDDFPSVSRDLAMRVLALCNAETDEPYQ